MKLKITKVNVGNHTISDTLRWPPENTMALGGVATGSMNANDVARAAGNIRYRGLTPIPKACKDDNTH